MKLACLFSLCELERLSVVEFTRQFHSKGYLVIILRGEFAYKRLRLTNAEKVGSRHVL